MDPISVNEIVQKGKEGLKFDLDKYGYFFVFVLFGLIEIIFSIVHNPAFIHLGLYFVAYGGVGYVVSIFLDKVSMARFAGKPPIYYGVIILIIKLLLLLAFLCVTFRTYPVR